MAFLEANSAQLHASLDRLIAISVGATAAAEKHFSVSMALRTTISSAMAEKARLAEQAAAKAYCNAALDSALAAADVPFQAALQAVDARAAQVRQELLDKVATVRVDLEREGKKQLLAESRREFW